MRECLFFSLYLASSRIVYNLIKYNWREWLVLYTTLLQSEIVVLSSFNSLRNKVYFILGKGIENEQKARRGLNRLWDWHLCLYIDSNTFTTCPHWWRDTSFVASEKREVNILSLSPDGISPTNSGRCDQSSSGHSVDQSAKLRDKKWHAK